VADKLRFLRPVLKTTTSTVRREESPMITTADAPPWLRRSDQAVTWARTMFQPHRAVVINCETTDLPGP
jgi:hypothetical protein